MSTSGTFLGHTLSVLVPSTTSMYRSALLGGTDRENVAEVSESEWLIGWIRDNKKS